MVVCHACGGENPDGFRHCGHCGASLAAPAPERRKLATMVFCDMSSSTALGERVDAEAVQELLREYFREMRAALERHGGMVEKFIGDAVVAAFGVPEAHEDDALRACRAALEMQARMSALQERLERRLGTRVAVRVGVNTGEVVTGGAQSEETFVTGDAVNTAARLEQAAAPGQVLVGESTYRLVRHAVSVEPVEPLSAKGKSEPLQAYRLLGVLDHGSLPRRAGAAFAGRGDELRLLEDEFEAVVDEGRCRIVTVAGEPGVGKSRLAAEFTASIAARARIVSGRCLSYGEGITFWAIGEIMRELIGIQEGHSVAEARALIDAHAEPVPNGPIVAATIAQVLGFADGVATHAETAWAIRHFLIANAVARPLVVVVDDIHWGEPTLHDLLEGLPATITDVPVLVLCLTRPELLEQRPDWPVAMRLEPLGARDVDALVSGLLGDAPASVRERLTHASAGNPLFAEELVAMLLEEGVLRVEDGVCAIVGDLDALTLPPSVHALVGARLDRLDPEPRASLERGAIDGEVFHRGAVIELSPPDSRPGVPAVLEALAAKELVRPTEASFAGEVAFRFKHILVRDVAYQETSKRLRATMHEQLAGWLERVAGERVVEIEEVVGYHLEQSYRLLAELGADEEELRPLGARAARPLAAAAHRARARGDVRAALSLFAAAAELSPAPLDRAGYALLQGAAAREAMQYGAARDTLEGVRAEAAEAGWPALEAGAEIELGWVSLHTDTGGTTSRLRAAGERALRTFEELGDDRGTAAALVLLARERWLLMHCAEAESLLERALPRAESSGDRQLLASVLVDLARAAVFGPRPAEVGVARLEALRERAGSIGPMGGASVSIMLAVLEASRGNSDRARSLGEEGKAVMRELAPDAILGFAHYVGFASLIAGDPAHAERELASTADRLEVLGERAIASTVVALRARALVELERYDEAEASARLGLVWGDSDDVTTQSYGRGALARSLAARGLMDEALANAQEAAELWGDSDFLNGRADALLDLSLVLGLAGRREHAVRAAGDALALYRAKGNVISGERAAALL
jgi:class 3 adenylate cyclase/tetratricopeptide (TPR) repeat protein